MTILVAARTGAAAVLAADSKLTTQVATGKNPDGTAPIFSTQTYPKICARREEFAGRLTQNLCELFCAPWRFNPSRRVQ
jgi:hypothetical protein